MNPILEAFLIVLAIGVIVFAIGTMIGICWFTLQRQHEADALSAAELDIPEDRDFTDPLQDGYAPCAPIRNSVLSPQSSDLSSFPHDADYQSTPTKRF